MERSEEIRKILGISRAAFSRKYNIPLRTLEDWDAGKKNPPEYVMDLLERAVREDKKTKEDGNMKNYKNYDRVETEIKYDKRFILDEEGNEVEREGVYTIDLPLTDEEKEPFLPKPQEDVLG